MKICFGLQTLAALLSVGIISSVRVQGEDLAGKRRMGRGSGASRPRGHVTVATSSGTSPQEEDGGGAPATQEVEPALTVVEEVISTATVTEEDVVLTAAKEEDASTASEADATSTATATEDEVATTSEADAVSVAAATKEDVVATAAEADSVSTATGAEDVATVTRASRRPNNADSTTTAEGASTKQKGKRPSLVSSLVKLSPASGTDGDGKEWWSDSTCGDDEFPIIIFMQTDSWASEMGFVMFDEAAPVNEYSSLSDFGDLENNQFYNGQICVRKEACYEFFFVDRVGDGFVGEGGLYVDVDGFNALDIRPGDSGTKAYQADEFNGEEFWGFRFGRTCGFGELYEPGYMRGALQHVDETNGKSANGNCGDASTAVLFEVLYHTDFFSSMENSLTLRDNSDLDDTFIWDYPIGAFTAEDGFETNPSSADYYFAICLDSTTCNEFIFEDTFGDMSPGSKLLIKVNGVEELELTPDEWGNITGDPAAKVSQEKWRLLTGACPLGA
jgi:hypothetical protein